MYKDFDCWNERKKVINITDTTILFFRERQIWWCRMGANIGFEQDGKGVWFKRPVLILRKFNQFAFIGIPLSTSNKGGPYHYQFLFGNESTRSAALLSQIRFIDSKRLDMKMGTCNKKDFSEIRKAVRGLFP